MFLCKYSWRPEPHPCGRVKGKSISAIMEHPHTYSHHTVGKLPNLMGVISVKILEKIPITQRPPFREGKL
jgi:hypothetical protein